MPCDREDVLLKLKECKLLFSKNADMFFKMHDPEFFSTVSDNLETAEEDILEYQTPEFYEEMMSRLEHFINVIHSLCYFYNNDRYTLTEEHLDSFTKGIKIPSEKSQDKARESMNEESLALLDLLTDKITEAVDKTIGTISIVKGCVTLFKLLDYSSSKYFCDMESREAGVTFIIRLRTATKNEDDEPTTKG